jgi:hypothetical protein
MATEAQKAASRRYYWRNRETVLEKLRSLDRTDYLVRRYGLTLKDYQEMHAAQDGRCAICSTRVEGERMCVDHDHGTGQVRGLLCRACNKSLGGFRDSVDLLAKAVEYLKRNS